MDTVSVVIATYNGARFLRQQLQSILDQTRKPEQVVICDDCSTDDTVEIARQFIREQGLSGWTLLQNPGNLGYIQNFRRAASQATGQLLFLCDQDDIWHPEKLEQMCSALEKNSQVSALVCGYRLIDSAGEPILSQEKKLYTPRGAGCKPGALSRVRGKGVFHENMAQGCAGAYRRELVDTWLRTDCVLLPHDWALHLMAYQEKGLYFLNRELLGYRLHGSNTTGLSDSGSAVRNRVPNLEKYAACLRQAAALPVPQTAQNTLVRLADFTDVRIRWLRSRRFGIWLGGFFSCFPQVVGYFFWQYLKDLALVIFKKVPES